MDPLALKIAARFAAKRPMKPEKLKELMLKLRKGAGSGLKMGVVMPLLRAALTGTTQGPDVFAIAEVLGKEKTISRMLQMSKRN